MSYIGNNLQTAFPSYLNIDDISGSFDGVTTSFPLTVGGVAPVPAPLSSNQCLISVGGVVQRPDDSGTEGFLLSGGNIVFSAAPAALDDFFGVILAGADYVNVGVNFPSGTATTPSITFDTDLDTGIYNPGANEIGFTTAGVNRVTINSSGNVSIVNDLTVDTNTLHVDSTNNRVGIGTTSPDANLTLGGLTNTGGQSVDALNVNRTDGLRLFGIKWDVSSNEVRFSGNTKNYVFRNGSSEAETARIDSSGRLLVGTSSYSGNSAFVIKGGAAQNVGLVDVRYGSTRPTGGDTQVSEIRFGSTDFASNSAYAKIQCITDGASSSDADIPGRLVFSTTADGSDSPTERLRLTSAGLFQSMPIYNTTGGDAANVVVNSSGTVYRSTSSAKYKTDIETLQDQYADAILTLRPVWYRSTCEIDNPDWSYWGFIAEEVAEVDPRLVSWKTAETSYDENGAVVNTPLEAPEPEGVQYDRFVPHLLNLIKRQQQAIEELQTEVAALKAQ